MDFGATEVAARNKSIQAALLKEPFFALRFGELFHEGWHLKPKILSKQGPSIEIEASDVKSPAAIRDVPVHPALRPLVNSLVASTKDGYLIPGLLTGGADGKRGHMEGKRFGYLIRKLGFGDPALDFHALRYSFTDRCRQAGVPESTADLITGHERPGKLSYGSSGRGYSQSLPLDILANEVAKVTYGELDGFLKGTGGDVRVESKSRRRPRAKRAVRGAQA